MGAFGSPSSLRETMDNTPEIMRELGELKGTQNAILQLLTKQDQRLDNHSERLSNLEKQRAWLVGAAAVVGLLLDRIAPYLGAVIK